METLRHQDWLRLHEVALDLHAAAGLTALPARVLAGVRRLFPCDTASLQDDRGGLRRLPWLYEDEVWQPAPCSAAADEPMFGVRVMTRWELPFHELREAFFAVSAEKHPHTDFYRRTGDGSARRLSEIMPMRMLRETSFFNEISRPSHLKWQLTIYLPLPPGDRNTLTLALSRQHPDFTDRERLLLDLLRPHLATAWRHALGAERQRRELRRLAPLPPPEDDTAACARRLGRLGLTPREAEVLLWVGHGKTNGEIAVILEMSPLTVKTHVERILGKLGCETRTAAARTALEALAGGGREG